MGTLKCWLLVVLDVACFHWQASKACREGLVPVVFQG